MWPQNAFMRTIIFPQIPACRLGLVLLWPAMAQLSISSLAAENTQALFNGKDLSGWRKPIGAWIVAKGVTVNSTNSERLAITPGEGILVNGADGNTVELLTEAEFGDVEV